MDETLAEQSTPETWPDEFAQQLVAERERSRQFIEEHRGQIAAIETELAEQLGQIASELERHRSDAAAEHTRLDRRRDELARQTESAARREARLREGQETDQREQEAQRQQIECRRAQLDERAAELAKLEARARIERQHTARRLRGHRRTRQQMQKRFDEERAAFERQLVECRAQLAELEHEREAMVRDVEREAAADRRIGQLELERDELVERAADAEARLAHTQTSGDAEALADMRRRHELALQDLREEKAQRQELEKQLAQAKANPLSTSTAAASDGMDWESQKRRLLASLESDEFDGPAGAADRISIEEAIRRTDEVVAEKNRLIRELTDRLEEQSRQSEPAVANDPTLDRDQRIEAERQRLQAIQEEWRDKLRQAEIDLSVERAKIARDRAEIEEKLRILHHERKTHSESGHAALTSEGEALPKKPAKGRWLARLGLKDEHDA